MPYAVHGISREQNEPLVREGEHEKTPPAPAPVPPIEIAAHPGAGGGGRELRDEEWLVPPYAPKDRLLPAPQADQNVWPEQCCPSFMARTSFVGLARGECWFCRHADFHLDHDEALKVGVCCYPTIVLL